MTNTLPEYVSLKGTILRLVKPDGETDIRRMLYRRDAGAWDVRFKQHDGKLYVKEPPGSQMYHVNGVELTPCSREEYVADNGRWVDGEDENEYCHKCGEILTTTLSGMRCDHCNTNYTF